MLTEGVTEGLSSAGSFGLGKLFDAVKRGIQGRKSRVPGGTWPAVNGHDVPWSEVHWTDHGTPHHHTNPHQHIFEYNPDKGGWVRKSPTIFEL